MVNQFKNLTLLDYILDKKSNISNDPYRVAIISVQHLLETTGSLFECFLKLGIPSQQIIVMGKLYSTNSQVAEKIKHLGIEVIQSSDSNEPGAYYELFIRDCHLLWNKLIENISSLNISTIIVLDDGGGLISTVPESVMRKYCVIGVEQTTSGIELNKEGPISIISVAGSAVKRYIEPAFISQSVIQKARKYLLNYRPKHLGIIGLGNIGLALVRDLKGSYPLTAFDIKKSDDIITDTKINIAKTADELFNTCDFIIGATGKDVSKESWINDLKTDKVLVSVSSGDIEFKSLLKNGKKYLLKPISSLLDDVIIENEQGHKLRILRGGTPINFDNNIHSVLPEHIQLTRALLLIGVIQAIENNHDLCKNRVITKLDLDWQKDILNKWFNDVNLSKFEFSVPVKKILGQSNFIEEESLGV